jgi:predicted alpha/beta hydrolase
MAQSPLQVRRRKIDIERKDGRKLSAFVVEPERQRLCVLISPGVGIPKENYFLFAREGAKRGAAVLLFDYRGQGASALPDVHKDLADFTDWGRLDLVAAIDTLGAHYPNLEMVYVGHSAGGWIAGLAENHGRTSRYCFVCAGWGYWRLKPLWFKPLELFFWHAYGPLCMGLYGYIPQGGLWRGEALNPKLFHQWKVWCHSPRCEASILAGGPGQMHYFDQIAAPIRSLAYRDDPIANERTVPMLLAVYANAEHEVSWAAPEDFGLPKIGHKGLFSRRAAIAWGPIWDWIVPASSPA